MARNMEFPELLLPEELVIEILSCLPVKSHVRFRCVSESWNSLISDSQFVKLHLHRSYARNVDFAHMLLLIGCHTDNFGRTYASSRSVSSLLESPWDIEVSRSGIEGDHSIGSCNGLICLRKVISDDPFHVYYNLNKNWVRFWNPATRLMAPYSPTLHGEGLSFGFGYDCSSDTYKVVAVKPSTDTMMNVYNMGDTCWRRIQVSPLPPLHLRGAAVYVSNTLNWLASLDIIHKNYEMLDTDPSLIVSFDLGKENYAQHLSVPCPRRRDEFHDFCLTLGVLRGCLCVSQDDRNTGNLVIWQMKEFGVHGSWTQLLNINVSQNFILYPCFAMCMSDNGDALLLERLGVHQAVLYTRKDDKLERTMISSRSLGCYLNNYIESLVSPC
ncbi:F-box/kelch-repeat protein At3g23880-like [Lotus japonicus]|uniref:F-box/kelch-repeat protein At3g23880-like n=1 Tax=Lotus japonicus TaxID=34305 RepID=UPI002582FEC2|nr:F-box/kelch-repeat protein At3g23880-like [Lotus japonicus]